MMESRSTSPCRPLTLTSMQPVMLPITLTGSSAANASSTWTMRPRWATQPDGSWQEADETYTHTPYFYTNVFDFGYQAVGTLSSDLQTIEDWQKPQTEGVVYYLNDEDRVQGVLLVNLDGGLDTARAILAEDWPHPAATWSTA